MPLVICFVESAPSNLSCTRYIVILSRSFVRSSKLLHVIDFRTNGPIKSRHLAELFGSVN